MYIILFYSFIYLNINIRKYTTYKRVMYDERTKYSENVYGNIINHNLKINTYPSYYTIYESRRI